MDAKAAKELGSSYNWQENGAIFSLEWSAFFPVQQGMLVFYSDPGTVDIAIADALYCDPAMTATGDERYWADITGIAAKSLSTYCVKNAEAGKAMNALAEVTAMYGYHANQYFTT